MRHSICTSVSHLDLNTVSSAIGNFIPEGCELYCLTDIAWRCFKGFRFVFAFCLFWFFNLSFVAGTPSNKLLRNKSIGATLDLAKSTLHNNKPRDMRILEQSWIYLKSVGVQKSKEIAHGITGTALQCWSKHESFLWAGRKGPSGLDKNCSAGIVKSVGFPQPYIHFSRQVFGVCLFLICFCLWIEHFLCFYACF